MAVVHVEGFDTYTGTGASTGLASRYAVSGTTAMVAGRLAGQAFRGGNTSANVAGSIAIPITGTASFSIGFAFKCPSFPALTRTFIAFLNGATYHAGLGLNSSGQLTAYRLTAANTGTSLGSSAAGTIIQGSWHYVEIEFTLSDTVGVFNVYVDGNSTPVLSLTGQDTRNGATTTIDSIQLGVTASSTDVGYYDYDDLYVVDVVTRLGERRVETIYPNSDVATGWTRSTGATNFGTVDEATASMTDYNSAAFVGDVDEYGLTDLSTTPTTVDAVQIAAYASKTDAAFRSIYLGVKSGATASDGSAYTLSTTAGRHSRLLTTDPDTATAWTASGVNSLNVRPKVAG